MLFMIYSARPCAAAGLAGRTFYGYASFSIRIGVRLYACAPSREGDIRAGERTGYVAASPMHNKNIYNTYPACTSIPRAPHTPRPARHTAPG